MSPRLTALLVIAALACAGCTRERFKIVQAPYLTDNVHVILKIDSQTGESWVLLGPANQTAWYPVAPAPR